MQELQELRIRLTEVNNLRAAASLLGWDQQTYMPPGGAEARGRQLATLRQIAHTKSVDPVIGKLLDKLRPYEESLPYESDDASLIRIARRDFEKAIKVPPEFEARRSAHAAISYAAWAKARPANDFAAVESLLAKTVDLSREYANFFPGYEHIADPLIDTADEGMKASSIRTLFANLREELTPIVQAIAAQPLTDDSCLKHHFPEADQIAFGLDIARQFGYDLDRGRLDKAPHPFTIDFSIGDVRITTRVRENNLNDALFSTLHEAGHAVYQQGIDPALEGLPLADGASSGVHESQSRLWENQVGRSRAFWSHYYPQLQQLFSDQLAQTSLDTFYRAINKVFPSLIRTDADEVTYNLHVMLRFELELALLEGELEVRDLPEAWRAHMDRNLGVIPPDDSDGVLQDVHWFDGRVGGMFQGYTLGNVLAAQFLDTALEHHPEISVEMEQGEFTTLHRWLRENIYHHGCKFTPDELVERITGGPIRIEPYINHIKIKYGELYQL